MYLLILFCVLVLNQFECEAFPKENHALRHNGREVAPPSLDYLRKAKKENVDDYSDYLDGDYNLDVEDREEESEERRVESEEDSKESDESEENSKESEEKSSESDESEEESGESDESEESPIELNPRYSERRIRFVPNPNLYSNSVPVLTTNEIDESEEKDNESNGEDDDSNEENDESAEKSNESEEDPFEFNAIDFYWRIKNIPDPNPYSYSVLTTNEINEENDKSKEDVESKEESNKSDESKEERDKRAEETDESRDNSYDLILKKMMVVTEGYVYLEIGEKKEFNDKENDEQESDKDKVINSERHDEKNKLGITEEPLLPEGSGSGSGSGSVNGWSDDEDYAMEGSGYLYDKEGVGKIFF